MKEPWRAPLLSDFEHDTRVVALDQTLSNCGLVVIRIMPDEDYRAAVYGCQVQVGLHQTIRPGTDLLSFPGTYEKGRQLDHELEPWLSRSMYPAATPLHVAYEMPSVAGRRAESSLLAGFVIARRCPGAVMVSPMHVHAVLAGKPRRAETAKQEIAEAVARYVPGSASREWNEHERDALAIGLTHLYDLKKAADDISGQ